jgi:hypothetical protein
MFPACTQIGFGSTRSPGYRYANSWAYFQWTVARWSVSTPARASRNAEMQTAPTRRHAGTVRLSHAATSSSRRFRPFTPLTTSSESISPSRSW